MSSLICNFSKCTKKCIITYFKILASSSFIPSKIITNEEIIQKYNNPFKSCVLIKSIDFKTRYIVEDHMANKYAYKALSKKCFDKIYIFSDNYLTV
jgi:3-oxoacyl-[acyl-carrier-protein] synthase-3